MLFFPSALSPILLRTQPTAFTLPCVPLQSHFLSFLQLEQVDLNAELQLAQSSCGPPVRSRPFAFSSLDKRKKRNLLSSLTERSQELPGLLALPSIPSNGQWEGGEEQGRLSSNTKSWDQGPSGGQHSHPLHADDSLKGYTLVKNLTSCYAQTRSLCDYAARKASAFPSH